MENLIISTLGQGLLWSLLAIGVFITFRVLDIADLTVEGSFPLGAAISVTLVVAGVNPVVSILAAPWAVCSPVWLRAWFILSLKFRPS